MNSADIASLGLLNAAVRLAALAETGVSLDKYRPSWLSSMAGAEAIHKQAEQLASGSTQSGNPHLLLSVLNGIGRSTPPDYRWPLAPLDIADDGIALFPTRETLDTQQMHSAYRGLWAKFERGLIALKSSAEGHQDKLTYAESLQNLLRRYAWCVPAAASGTADVSLYDHARMSAALAACLVRLNNGQATPPSIARLVEGDISGVQKFIYTISSKGAAKGLRGRSLYLQLLTEAAARYVLRAFDLPITNLIYVGGGHFYALLPYDANLGPVQAELDQMLLAHHDGALSLALGTVDLHPVDFNQDKFAHIWRQVAQNTGEAKRRRYSELTAAALESDVFNPRGHGGNEETECQVCHAESADVIEQIDEEGEDTIRKCALCAPLETLGGMLRDAEYLVLAEIPAQARAQGTWHAALAQIGMAIGLANRKGWLSQKPPRPMERVTILGLRDFSANDLGPKLAVDLECPVAVGVRYTVNVTPRNGERILTFSDMQRRSIGLKRLGVLRMDIDDLGQLFAAGLQSGGRSRATLARIAGVSSALSLFFEGWVNELCKQANETIGPVYAIYSGGDDLFIVGAWHVLPELARAIRDEFRRFTGENDALHLSGGITLHGGKYPLYQAAREAGEALDHAKALDGKNALDFLDQSVKWEALPAVVALNQELYDLVKANRGVGRSLLHVLMQLYSDYLVERDYLRKRGEGYTRDGQPQMAYGPWMWHGAYLLARLAERTKGDAKAQVLALRNNLMKNVEIIGPAARWAEALTKPEQEDRN